jgi:hypothetical protein
MNKKLTIVVMALSVTMLGNVGSTAGPNSAAKTDLAHNEAQLIGTWTGESICQVKNSPCHDEKAIYRISKAKEAGKVTIDLEKIVDGKAETMVVLDFKYESKNQKLICAYKHGVWEFTVNGNQMSVTLTTPDKVVYRRVSLKKDQAKGK